MKRQSARELIAMGLIAGAIVAGTAMMINARLEQGLERRRAQLSMLSAESRFSPDASRAHHLAKEAQRLFDWIERGAPSFGAPLYSRLLTLGDQHGVQVDRIDPVAGDDGAGAFAGAAGFGIEATGEYEPLARFIGAIEREDGFNVVVRFSVTPVEHGEGELVRASIQTMHYRFDPSALRTQLAAFSEEDE